MDARPVDPHRELSRLVRASRTVPSLGERTWRRLLCGYLAAEPYVIRVLGDWCLEREIPNMRPGALDQRVRYVLGVLPPEAAHRLACDLVEHALGDPPSPRLRRNQASKALHQGLATKRLWLDGAVEDQKLREARREVSTLSPTTHGREALLQCLSSSPSPSVPQRISSLTAELRQGPRYSGSNGYAHETRWQAEHLRAFLAG